MCDVERKQTHASGALVSLIGASIIPQKPLAVCVQQTFKPWA